MTLFAQRFCFFAVLLFLCFSAFRFNDLIFSSIILLHATYYFFFSSFVTDVPPLSQPAEIIFCRFLYCLFLFHFTQCIFLLFSCFFSWCISLAVIFILFSRGFGLLDFRFAFLLCFLFLSAESSDFFQAAFRSARLLTYIEALGITLLFDSKAFCS